MISYPPKTAAESSSGRSQPTPRPSSYCSYAPRPAPESNMAASARRGNIDAPIQVQLSADHYERSQKEVAEAGRRLWLWERLCWVIGQWRRNSVLVQKKHRKAFRVYIKSWFSTRQSAIMSLERGRRFVISNKKEETFAFNEKPEARNDKKCTDRLEDKMDIRSNGKSALIYVAVLDSFVVRQCWHHSRPRKTFFWVSRWQCLLGVLGTH